MSDKKYAEMIDQLGQIYDKYIPPKEYGKRTILDFIKIWDKKTWIKCFMDANKCIYGLHDRYSAYTKEDEEYYGKTYLKFISIGRTLDKLTEDNSYKFFLERSFESRHFLYKNINPVLLKSDDYKEWLEWREQPFFKEIGENNPSFLSFLRQKYRSHEWIGDDYITISPDILSIS